jgi:hypothetical protein
MDDRRIDKPFWALVSRPAVTSVVSAFCGADPPSSLEKLMRPPPPKAFCRSLDQLKARREAGSGSVC